MTRKLIGALILFIAVTLPAAAFDLNGGVSLTITLKPGKIEFDLSVDLDIERDGLSLDTTWKADEKGAGSLKLVGAGMLPRNIDAEAEIVFDDASFKTARLALDDLPVVLTRDSAEEQTVFLDVQARFKAAERPYLYELRFDADPPEIGCLSSTLDLTLREDYVRGTLDLEHDPWEARLRETWKGGVLDAREATLSYSIDGFDLEEDFNLTVLRSGLRPEEGTLSLDCDAAEGCSVALVGDHTFTAAGIVVDRLTATVALDADRFDLSWRGRFEPGNTGFDLADVDLALSSTIEVDPFTITPKFKLDETGFRSFSIKLATRFSAE